MVKKLSALYFVVILLLLSACQTQKNIVYSGESDSWSAKIDVMQADDMEVQDFTLLYQGEDFENVGESKITYTIETDTGSSSGTGVLTNGGVLEGEAGNCSGCAFVQEDDEFTFTVDWAGKKESITLKIED